MLTFFDTEKRRLEESIKANKRGALTHIGWLIFNFTFIILDSLLIYNGTPNPAATGFSLGVFTGSFLWSSAHLAHYYFDYKFDKQCQVIILKTESETGVGKARREYEDAREQYEKAYSIVLEQHLKNNPETSAK